MQTMTPRTDERPPRRRSSAGPSSGSWESDAPTFFLSFHTLLGWMALLGSQRGVRRLTLAHPTRDAAIAAVGHDGQAERSRSGKSRPAWADELVRRLRAYADGEPVDFSRVPLDVSWRTAFQKKVVRACRAIDYGRTMTYGQLARAAGSPRAARAVGNVMASNPTPLVVPCHRVVASGGALGGFSAGEGIALKRRLLEMEAEACRYGFASFVSPEESLAGSSESS